MRIFAFAIETAMNLRVPYYIILWLLLPVRSAWAADSLSAPALWRELQQANVLMAQGKNDSALLLSREVLPKVEACGNVILLAMNHALMGTAYSGEGEKEKAREEFAFVAALSEAHHFQEEARKPKNDFLYVVMLSVYGQLAAFSDEMGQTAQSVEYSRRGMEWANLRPDAENTFAAVSIFSEILLKNGLMPSFAADADSLSREDMADVPPKEAPQADPPAALPDSSVPAVADTLQAVDNTSLPAKPVGADMPQPGNATLPMPLLLAGLLLLLIGLVLWQLYLRKKRQQLTARQMEERFREGQEQERARLARELHDDVSNQLLAVEMKLNSDGLTQQAMQLLNESREHVRRVSHELLPPEFEHVTLWQAIASYAKGQDGLNHCQVDFVCSSVDADWSAVPAKTSLEVYRVVQEAVANAQKHGGATRISVGLGMDDNGRLEVLVSDNGASATAQSSTGIGQYTMRQRAKAIGGELEFFSHHYGNTLRLTVGIGVKHSPE